MQTLPLVSIIIPSYNRKEELATCISSVTQQDYPNTEIIVVDDNSTDGTVNEIRNRFPQVMFISNNVNCGPSYRRNQGILKSKGEYLLFLDSDVELQDPSIISRMIRRFQKDNSIGELGGEIAIYDGEKDIAFGRGISYTGRTYRIAASGTDERICDYLATCNCMVRKDVAVKVGGFDPYYRFGSEDTDFGFAIQKHGYKNIVGLPYAVYHKASRTGRHPDETYRYRVTRIRFLLKSYGLKKLYLLFLIDMMRVITFYPFLPFKIVAKLLLKKSISHESYTGGWLILKAYIWNLWHFNKTIRARTTNFLSIEEMERFKNS